MKKINESFICVGCWNSIPLADKTCRNHCPFCFVSLHVDWDVPGDRSTECHGMMYPIDYILLNSDYKILFQCSQCWKLHWNKRAIDDEVVNLPDLIDEYKKNLL